MHPSPGGLSSPEGEKSAFRGTHSFHSLHSGEPTQGKSWLADLCGMANIWGEPCFGRSHRSKSSWIKRLVPSLAFLCPVVGQVRRDPPCSSKVTARHPETTEPDHVQQPSSSAMSSSFGFLPVAFPFFRSRLCCGGSSRTFHPCS